MSVLRLFSELAGEQDKFGGFGGKRACRVNWCQRSPSQGGCQHQPVADHARQCHLCSGRSREFCSATFAAVSVISSKHIVLHVIHSVIDLYLHK